MNDQPHTICKWCREPVEPGEPGVVEAVELIPVPSFQAEKDTAEGMKALFHAACFPEGDPRYQRL